jgi:HSP20 family protein
MNLVRFDPIRDFHAIQNRFDRIFGEAVSRQASVGEDEPLRSSWLPAVDVHENETAITLRTELPGLSLDDVELTIDKGRLTIQGEKRLEKEDTDGDYRRIEASYGSFYRSFPLPDSVDQEAVEARFENGVLYIVLPKTEEAKPKRIAVKIS